VAESGLSGAGESTEPTEISGGCERSGCAETVEKVAAGLFQFRLQKIGLSDRPANRSRTPVKDKKTPENLARTTVSDFFQKYRSI
jgi:hypothetical protein